MKRLAFLTITLPLLSACAGTTDPNYQYYLQKKGLDTPIPQHFQHCHGYGCKHISVVNFTQNDWQEFEKLFSPPPPNAAAERKRIARAIALFEQKVGRITGTDEDIWGTFQKTGPYQLDCVDESTNTTIYLSLLEQEGLLRFHRIEAPTARVPILHAGRWPHQTALISETDTSRFFVVDSWFHNNGELPEIVPLKDWKAGWKPEKKENEER
ncbi:MAG: hypothetical protein KDI46_08900 [Alphaproteobacteria bacterium]|nr:hypothetical protein [Alphaproteobacteria bacterium]